MKTGITRVIGLGALILSALAQETIVETANTNATQDVLEVVTESTNAMAEVLNVEIANTNATELAVERESMTTDAADLLGPALSTELFRRLEAPDEIVSGNTTFKGPLTVLFKKQNPLAVFNPFRPETPGEKTERPLWDPYLGAPRGIVLFGIHR